MTPHSQPKPTRPRTSRRNDNFPIVGIGTSAGGLEALTLFLKAMPAQPGMAFLIVQHLAPDHKQILGELLAPHTLMPVIEIEDGMPVAINSIYVIPPNKDLSIHNRTLFLLDPVSPRGVRLPIDTFFKSLALDLEEKSIGVILSGMGRDGTEGLKSIKESLGICFVQEPASAKYEDMPKNAIQAGVADIVSAVEDLPDGLIAYAKNLPLRTLSTEADDSDKLRDLQKIILLLHRHSGQDFSEYKVNTLLRRVERRIGLHQLTSMTGYIRYLQETPIELDLLLNELLIGVTQFFRDPPMWDALREQLFPEWFEKDPVCHSFRIWVPGCSTGEEAYTIAILFQEALQKYRPAHNPTLQVFATDLNHAAIEIAREGIFSAEAIKSVPESLVNTYFNLTAHDTYQVAKPIRESIIFAQQNVLMDPPFTKIDLLMCRNLLIYLTVQTQEKLFPLFHFSLNPRGYLVLGSAETIGNLNYLFDPVQKAHRIFQKAPYDLKSVRLDFPSFMRPQPSLDSPSLIMTKQDSLQALTDKTILNHISPPSVMVNEQGDVVYISGSTGKFLEPAVGKANWNIFAMIHPSLRQPLESAFEECRSTKNVTIRKQLLLKTSGEGTYVDLVLYPLSEPEQLKGKTLVVFKELDVNPDPLPQEKRSSKKDHDQVTNMEKELLRVRSELHHTREKAQSSQEEFRSMNEELQSINEELTTSREEIQSMNEELQTLNAELQQKVDDLSLLNNDLNNILNRTEIATLFLDAELNIRLFTAGVTEILNLIKADVGRHISDIALKLNYLTMAEDTQDVLKTLVFHDQEACNPEGNWYSIRIVPYRTVNNLIDGAVITFTDITASKTLEAQLREQIAEKSQSTPPQQP